MTELTGVVYGFLETCVHSLNRYLLCTVYKPQKHRLLYGCRSFNGTTNLGDRHTGCLQDIPNLLVLHGRTTSGDNKATINQHGLS